jgi:D-alanyl-D-alanine carboxypeptidase
MFTALTSLLFLGMIPATLSAPPARMLPGIELVSIAPPTSTVFRSELPKLSASGMSLIDLQSGEEIMSINPDQKRPIASLTKIMTALLILENHELKDAVTIPPIAESIRGSTLGLIPGQHFTVGTLLKALLIPSANDAAYALAVFHAHNVGAFVREMNERALALGLTNTHFSNPAGLDNDSQYSTPRDLAWLTVAALKNPDFRAIVGTRSARITNNEGQVFDLRNTNELLHYNQDVYGVKTGTTDAAQECLVVLFKSHNHPYLLVLLGSHDRYTDSLYVLQAVNAAAK